MGMQTNKIWDYRYLAYIDLRMVAIILALMTISIVVIAAHTLPEGSETDPFFTPMALQQLQRMGLGIVLFLFLVGFDYNKLREWTWIFYLLTTIALVGVFFTNSIQGVHRWYRIPLINISIQPSEYAKLTVVMALSWFLERIYPQGNTFKNSFFSLLILAIPFLLILKQPDLGTALILLGISLVMFYFGEVHSKLVTAMSWLCGIGLLLIALIFLGAVHYETIRPFATKFLKEYQFDRLDPNTHHQKAAITAIALGGITGKGWRKGEYTQGGWLPTPYTDSVFSSFGEEFGFIGLVLLLLIFYALIYCSFQVCVVAPNLFGRLLAAGIATYVASHLLINVGMMTGFLPITGVPLILVTYGGSSVLLTMSALGILQSIYCRRFMFQ